VIQAGWLATQVHMYDYTQYQYIKIAVYIPENAMLVIPLSLGRNFVLLTRYALAEADRRQ